MLLVKLACFGENILLGVDMSPNLEITLRLRFIVVVA